MSQKVKDFLKRVSLAIVALTIIGFTLGVVINASKVASVTVTLLEGRQEPSDLVLPGMDKKVALPDYQLQIRTKDGWIDCGTFQDTPIGSGLTWNVPGTVPVPELVEYKLLESDRGLDDLVDQVPAASETVSGKMCMFSQTHGFALDAGFIWFMQHPLGSVIGITFAIMLVLYIFSHFAV